MRRSFATGIAAASVLTIVIGAQPAGAVRVTTEVFLGDLNDVFFGAGEPLVFVIDPSTAMVTIDEDATHLTALGQPVSFSLTAPIDFATGVFDGAGFIEAPQIGISIATDHADGAFVESPSPELPIDPWDGIGVGAPVSLLMTAGCDVGGSLVHGIAPAARPRHFIECGISLFLTAFVVSEDFGDIDCATAPEGARCEDGDACTVGDLCAAGACVPGPPADCEDGDACSIDSCDPVAGCTSVGGDADSDGVCDDADNCPLHANAGQLDVDPVDGIGDACECRAAAPGTCVADGRGPAGGECLAELILEPTPPISPSRGLPERRVRCTDGNVCDLDGTVDGTCRFRLAVCLNNRDPRTPSCAPLQTELVLIKRPSRESRRTHEAAAARGLVASIEALAPATVEGSREERVHFMPPTATLDACGRAVDVEVPITGRKGRLKVSLRAEGLSSTGAEKDRDALKLFCLR